MSLCQQFYSNPTTTNSCLWGVDGYLHAPEAEAEVEAEVCARCHSVFGGGVFTAEELNYTNRLMSFGETQNSG